MINGNPTGCPDGLDIQAGGNTFQRFYVPRFGHAYKEIVELQDDSEILSSSMLGTGVTIDGQKIESYFDDDIHVLKYCLARIDEIEAINSYSHTPSAYSCILSFLAFLAQASNNATGQEERHFIAFCNKHMRRLQCKREERTESGESPTHRMRTTGQNTNTWGEVLYRLVRCGLIHAMSSSGNRDPLQNEVEVRLSHSPLRGDGVETVDFEDIQGNLESVLDPWNAVRLTINAFDLIDAVRDSILHIYTERSDVENMRKYFKDHPPLMAVIENQ